MDHFFLIFELSRWTGALQFSLVFLLLFTPVLGFSQTGVDLSGVNGGSVKIGEDSRPCTVAIAGAMRFHPATSSIQICQNNAPTGPSGCSSVGEVCSDGTLYAFSRNYGSGNEKVYVTATNQSAAIQWKATIGVDDITSDSATDGKINVANLASAVSNFPAIELCDSLTLHSSSDWYLPATDELNDLYLNRVSIDGNASEAFTSAAYWSSSENNLNNVKRQNFGTGTIGNTDKDQNRDVRCIRRGATDPGGYAWTTWGA